MRISDWSSDVCSSDLEYCGFGQAQFLAYVFGENGLRYRVIWIIAEYVIVALLSEGIGRAYRQPRHFFPGQQRQLWQDMCSTYGQHDRHGFFTKKFFKCVHGFRRRIPIIGKHHFYGPRSEENTSEHQSLLRISYTVFCLKKKKKNTE